MHRFFVPMLQPNVDEEISLLPIHNQLFRVLRAQPGEQILVLDNAGSERLMEIVRLERRDTIARVLKVRAAPAQPAIPVTLYQCILRADKFDLVLQKATELGVTTIVPVLSSRTVARMGSAVTPKHSRWRTIVREAAEQSGRGEMPTVAPACSFEEAIATATGARLIPWEEAKSKPGFLAALGQVPPPVESVSILIGPEGGFEAGEVEQAAAAGWRVVSMGKRILRAETAAMVALSLVALAVGDLGDAPVTHSFVPVPDESRNAAKADKPDADKPASDKTAGDKTAGDKPVTAVAGAEPVKAASTREQATTEEKPVANTARARRIAAKASRDKARDESRRPAAKKPASRANLKRG